VDEWAEVWDLLKPYADGSFWQMPDLDPANTYIVGRVVLKENWDLITDWATRYPGRVVFSNPAEGSETILLQLTRLRIADLVQDGRIGLLTSGDLEPGIHYCKTDCYFSNIVEYTENKAAQLQSALDYKTHRPYEFLFLNGRLRPHRKYLIDALRSQDLLKDALWTNLGSQVEMEVTSVLQTNKLEYIRLLPPEYEIPRARPNLKPSLNSGFVKHELFGNTWGDAIVNPQAYMDTCFSLVTETIFDYPHTFRTEKIWKPMIMCHPFVVAANSGYYQDLKNAGFQTFGNLIDESFDMIDNAQDRANAVVATVKDICYNGASSFLVAAREVCKYNYQHLREHNARERNCLPQNLIAYLNE
jgi:hypothetical protein